jgi:hypothetical protein
LKLSIPQNRFSKKYAIDLSLTPLAVILLELAMFFTEFARSEFQDLRKLILLRIVHTAYMSLIAQVMVKQFNRFKIRELNLFQIMILGIFAVTPGITLHRILAPVLHVQIININRNIGIGLLQALIWFPILVMAGSRKTEIFFQFRQYESRLIASTRSNIRQSPEFQELQNQTRKKIRDELVANSKSLRDQIATVDFNNLSLLKANEEIQRLLLKQDLRELSRSLVNRSSEYRKITILGQNLQSIKLLVNQFRILFVATSRLAPLKSRYYALLLILLVTPSFVGYFTFLTGLIVFPILSFVIFLSAYQISRVVRSDSRNSPKYASLLILATGLIPGIFNLVGQTIHPNPATKFPLFVNFLFLPLIFLLLCGFVQGLQPAALKLIRDDTLDASRDLKKAIRRIVNDEFEHNFSHRWAIYIHGKILTRLAASALKLDIASNSGDKQTFERTTRAILELLENPDSGFEEVPLDLESEVASRLDPWTGLLEINLYIDQELKSMRTSRVRELGEVIEELISNSTRHGKAQKVNFEVIKRGDSEIQITAVDDAPIAPPEFQNRYGLGTRIFNLASDGRWTINRLDSSTVVQLVMTI